MHYLCIKYMKNYKGLLTLIELAPSPYFSTINVYLEDINVFVRFDDIPSLTVANIKEKPKCHGPTDGKTHERTARQTT